MSSGGGFAARRWRVAIPDQRSGALWLGAVVMLALAAPLVWFYAGRVGHTLLENHNEGWNALFIDRAMTGGRLYPGPDELLLNNYPPLSFYIVGLVAQLTGDAMTAGRLVSTLAFLVVALLVGFIVGRRGRSGAAGVFAAAFFVLMFACFPGQRIGMNDPQLLAHAIMTAGLALIWLWPGRTPVILGAAVLMVLAGLTKHNLIAMPLATTLWIGGRDRRALLIWLAAAALAGAVGLAVMLGIWGPPLLQQMMTGRHAYLARAFAYSRKLIALIDIPLAAGAVGVATVASRPDRAFAGLLLAAGLLEMAVFAGGDGVVANIAFDLLIAVALSIGLAVSALRRPASMVALLLYYVALVLPIEQVQAALTGNPARAAREASVRSDLAYMQAHPGPALCFDMALCWYAGRPPVFDQFNIGEQFSLGQRAPEALAGEFRDKRFAVVEVFASAMPGPTYALPQVAWTALMQNYIQDRQSEDRVFLVPKP